ncbi:hypothetical protein C0J52_21365 [Blattella germanica]|nr:hypothetical protein C0J52_21365 [Blattella germanica]
MEEEEEDLASTNQQQTRTVLQSSATRVQSYSTRTTKSSSSTVTVSSFERTPSDGGDKSTILEEDSSSFSSHTTSSSTKAAIRKSQGRLAHMTAYEALSDESVDVSLEDSSKLSPQESQSTAQTSVITKSPMMYLSASQEDSELVHKRNMSRSLSPMSSTSSDGTGLSPSRTLTTARSVETSTVGREGRQWLTASAGTYRSETAKSMESLRSNSTASAGSETKVHHHRHSFLTSSERDMRRVVASSVEARSLENLEKEIRLMGKRKAVSGEELIASEVEAMSAAERRRGLYAGVKTHGERRTAVPQHLSLPPPGAYLTLATPGGDRKLTILSPHSPHPPDLLQFSSSLQTLKTRRKKAIVLPKLILPRSESEVFLE